MVPGPTTEFAVQIKQSRLRAERHWQTQWQQFDTIEDARSFIKAINRRRSIFAHENGWNHRVVKITTEVVE